MPYSNTTDYVTGTDNISAGAFDPSDARLGIAGLLEGGRRRTGKGPETRVDFMTSDPQGRPIPIDKDWRVRIGVSPSSKIFYEGNNAGILSPLKTTMGVVFPYTPSITTSYVASYGQIKTTHSNQPAYFYENSEVQAIQINGEFTVQNQKEGQYLLACIYFFRSCTKMFFGSSNNGKDGNPPPMVFLNGFGSHLLPNVPCVVTSFQQVMTNEVDYIEVPAIESDPVYTGLEDPIGISYNQRTTTGGTGRTTRLPTSSQLVVSLQPVYSRKRLTEFNLDEFAAGRLINRGFI
jgi:hypothetical protein